MNSETTVQCPAHKGDTTGSDSYSFSKTKGQGHCFSCDLRSWTDDEGRLWGKHGKNGKSFLISGEYVPDTDEEYLIEENLELDQEYEYVASRGIRKETKEFFDIRTYRQVPWKAQNNKTKKWEEGVSDEEHAIYPNGSVKIRRLDLPKDHFAHFAARGPLDCFFGQNLFPAGCAKKLTIVEGDHYDTPSAYQMLEKGSYLNPVVSVPGSKPSGRFWENTRKYLESFDELILSVDNDKAGSEVADVMFDLYPGKVMVVNHGDLKDASDFLQAGRAKDYVSAWWQRRKYSPAGFTAGAEAWLQALDEESPYTYVQTPIEGFNQVARGIVKGGITVLKAPPGSGKCLGPEVPVMMYNGDIKPAKSVVVGDVLMGDDGSPRNVLSTTTGVDEMYKINPIKGDSWTCNSHHVLSLYHNGNHEIVDIPIKDYLEKGSDFKHRAKQYRVPVRHFNFPESYPFVAPYAYGVFLGDGSKSKSEAYFGVLKKEVMEEFKTKVEQSGFLTTTTWYEEKNCWGVRVRTKDGKHGTNPFIKFDTSLVDFYKRGSEWVRRQFLAGILDTDGYLGGNCYELTQKDERVIDAVAFAARSLGLAAYKRKVTKSIKEIGFTGEYFKLSISGEINIIPTLRHKPNPRKQVKNVLRTGFSIEPLGKGTYYGFEVDGNSRFLLGDFTVTHNSSLLRYLQYDQVVNRDCKVAVLMMEEVKSITGRAMATQVIGKNVMTKEDAEWNDVSEEEVKEALRTVVEGDRFVSFEVNPQDPITDTLEKCKQAVLFYDVDYIYIDHLQRLAYLAGTDTATANLTQLGVQLTEFAKRKNVGIIPISHVNEDGHTKYAKAIEEEAIVLIELSRDKEAEDFDERNTAYLTVTKNRPFGTTGPSGALTYDPTTTILTERIGPKPPPTKRTEDGF